jgi:hypothetical protein
LCSQAQISVFPFCYTLRPPSWNSEFRLGWGACILLDCWTPKTWEQSLKFCFRLIYTWGNGVNLPSPRYINEWFRFILYVNLPPPLLCLSIRKNLVSRPRRIHKMAKSTTDCLIMATCRPTLFQCLFSVLRFFHLPVTTLEASTRTTCCYGNFSRFHSLSLSSKWLSRW